MSQQNIELIKNIYSLFNERKFDEIAGHMADDIVWIAADSSPLADESPYNGKSTVRTRVFGRIEAGFEKLTIRADEIYSADGDRVVVLGYYSAILRGSGKTFDAQLAHIWTVQDGKLKKFQQYVDTYKIAESMK
jgi:ketosteroid isomerase-like protein